MTWITSEQKKQKELAIEFLEYVNDKKIVKCMGAHDSMAALVAKSSDFKILYLSGGALTASKGMPDIGLINSTEVAERAREIVRATNLPLLVDIDNGFGGPLNVARTIKEMEEANVAAVQIEDQSMPKKCGHLNGKQLITTNEMIEKIKMIKKISPSMVVVARTDARSVEGMEMALERTKAYEKAGADIIFPEAITKKVEFKEFSNQIKIPLLANMTEFGKTPYYTANEYEELGYSIVIYPVTSLRVAAKAYEKAFDTIMEEGTQKNILDDMQTREQLYEKINLQEYEELDNNIAKTELPNIEMN